MRSSPRHKLSKAAIKAWRISTIFFILIIVLIPFTLWGTFLFVNGLNFSQWTIIAVSVIVVILGALAIFFIPEIRWRRWYYDVDEHEVDLQSGIIIITRTLVPVKRVQHVDTRQGPILRSYGLADVTISTAATTHRIPALDMETADEVRDQISKFARLAKEDV
jgi:membrane protein YdbS with pleckstrin-like domain